VFADRLLCWPVNPKRDWSIDKIGDAVFYHPSAGIEYVSGSLLIATEVD